jgi:hypothetical protein
MLTPDITRCEDSRCPQKLTCSRWMERDDPRARGRIDTMRDPTPWALVASPTVVMPTSSSSTNAPNEPVCMLPGAPA